MNYVGGRADVCMDAGQAHAALSVRPVKTDQNDARGLAEMVRMGWYREVKVKTLSAHGQRGLLMARQRLIVVRRQIEEQMRGLLKTFGLVVGTGVGDSFVRRVKQLAHRQPIPGRRTAATLLTRDETRRIASNIAKIAGHAEAIKGDGLPLSIQLEWQRS